MGASLSLEPLAVPVAEAARLHGLRRESVYRAINAGELRAIVLGGRKLVPVVELERVLGIQHASGPSVEDFCKSLVELLSTAIDAKVDRPPALRGIRG